MMDERYDVVVVGGGPAGAATAALTAVHGHSTLLLERTTETPEKVGESLMPACWWTLNRLGVVDRMRESRFPKKYSVQFFGGSGRASAPFYFFERDDHESSQTWQVRRSEFDEMLLDNAARRGADVRRGVSVAEVLFEPEPDAEEGERAVGVELADGTRVGAKVVVDASGQSGILARRFGLKELDPQLRNASIYTHFEGARRDAGIDEGATLILHTETPRHWFWFIPLPDGIASVGLVGPVDELVKGRDDRDPQAIFDSELARCPGLLPRLEEARRLAPVKVAKDFTYRARRMAGDGWILVGDAYGFIDPIYSSGVFLALKSAEMAADAIDGALSGEGEGDGLRPATAEELRRFEGCYVAGMEAIRRLVHAFYDPSFSFAGFLERHPGCRDQVVDILVGNVFRKPVTELLDALDAEGVGRGEALAAEAVATSRAQPGAGG